MTSQDSFTRDMADWATHYMRPHTEARLAARSAAPGSVVPPPELTEEETRFMRLFEAFTEISASYEAILDTRVYVGRFPFARTRISRSRYLAQQIAVYFNEIYILKERLIEFAKLMKESFRHGPFKARVDAVVTPVFKRVSHSLAEITATRGSHVHDRRYTDSDLHMLDFYDLMHRTGRQEFEYDYKIHYALARSKWIKVIDDNESALEILLEDYFKAAHQALFASGAPLDVTQNPERRPSNTQTKAATVPSDIQAPTTAPTGVS